MAFSAHCVEAAIKLRCAAVAKAPADLIFCANRSVALFVSTAAAHNASQTWKQCLLVALQLCWLASLRCVQHVMTPRLNGVHTVE